jgi:hypothetical protein
MTPVPTLPPADLERALEKYRELHAILLSASRLPLDDLRRWRLSLRYNELRADLSLLFGKYLRAVP